MQTFAATNFQTADYRIAQQKPQARPCDGLQYPCERPATHRVVMNGPNYERTPIYITTDLCDQCYAEWQSWQ